MPILLALARAEHRLKERYQDWHVVILLCDYAEELNGKLYIMGGGWSRLFTPNVPSNMALAVKISVPWGQANRPFDLAVRLVDEDGHPAKNQEGQDIELTGNLEVGRPPGMRPGTYLDAPLAVQFRSLILAPGSYLFKVEIDGTELAHTPFEVVKAE